MQVTPYERPQSAAWWHWHDGGGRVRLLSLSAWTEKRPERGEDAEPLLLHHAPSDRGLLAVFDGAGGAGAAVTGRSVRGVDRTGAWVGARTARAATEEWFHRHDAASSEPAETLRARLTVRLGEMRPEGRRKIGGTMRQVLPTTVAALNYQVTAEEVRWLSMWAGDSRCFLLTPSDGLQQLSRDDTESDDALALLLTDPPMTNLVSAEREFRVNTAPGAAPLPAVLITATDGFFGYVRTPAEFEHVLLSTMGTATDAGGWAEALCDRAHSASGDDASLALLAVGFGDFPDLQHGFAGRAGYVRARHWAPMEDVRPEDRDGLVAAREDSWMRYRPSYERRLPARWSGAGR
jgi:serine/threonine protein phosphatase PrpC